ncbi:MAG: methyl-accepting chemotaxis protein [Deltaproteobacteria bacterium]|nr:methyl-accepting chemotaxis protein [Deltaproteobacteria bacterium]
MNWFTNMSTRSKFLLSFGVVIALMIIIIITAMRGLIGVKEAQNEVFNHEFANSVDLMRLVSMEDEVRTALLTMIMAGNNAQKEIQNQKIRESSEGLDKTLLRLYERNKHEPTILKRLDELNSIRLAFKQTRDSQLIPLIYENKLVDAKKLAFGVQAERFQKMRSISEELGKESVDTAQEHIRVSDADATQSVRIFIVLGVLAIIGSGIIAMFLNKIIAKPLQDISSLAEKIAAGDLTVNTKFAVRPDEVGVLQQMFGAMVEKLQKQTRDLLEAVTVLASSSNEIAATTAQLASGTEQTAVSVAETTTTVEEVKQTANLATQKAKHVSEISQNAVSVSQNGSKLVNETIDGINRIREQMEYIAETIVKLSEHNQAIGEIIATVDDLAEQSNLLAVNASIEAAKVGEHGKGFIVVAQEIKSLAEQSKQATKQVRTILNDIQKASTTAVMATEKGTKAVEATVRQSSGTGESIQELSRSISEASQAVLQIAASNQQQLVGMDQVALAMINIKQASTQNAASTKQVEITVRNLNDLGQKLKKIIEHYKV